MKRTPSAIIDSAVAVSSEIVNFHLNALVKADLSNPPAMPVGVIYRFPGPKLNASQRREMHENWILARAFHELLRAVRHALEEAHFYTKLLTKSHKARSDITLEATLKRKAASLHFPELLAQVSANLGQKLEFADSYKSLQAARNCLEHRDGVVSMIETKCSDTFIFSMPRVKLFYTRNGAEVELEKNHVVDPGDDRKNVEIMMKLETRKRSFSLGERLIFTLDDFNEIAFACHYLGQQLSRKIARPQG